jgi:dienelactone hydrolase
LTGNRYAVDFGSRLDFQSLFYNRNTINTGVIHVSLFPLLLGCSARIPASRVGCNGIHTAGHTLRETLFTWRGPYHFRIDPRSANKQVFDSDRRRIYCHRCDVDHPIRTRAKYRQPPEIDRSPAGKQDFLDQHPEQDTLIFGETVFHWVGGDSDSEHAGLSFAFRNVYSEMRKQGSFSSPVLSTYLNLQRPNHFDAVIVEPETQARFGVVFLHGYMGNVTAQCWVIAQAVKDAGGVTVCPSTVWTGQWWLPEGQQILQSSFDYLRKQGIQKLYLGGFSNGGFSIGHLLPQLADQKGLSGLMFIDGFYGAEDVKQLELPVLILEGTQDTRVPVYMALQFAQEVGDLGTYVAIDSDHFLIIKEPGLVQDAIASWK